MTCYLKPAKECLKIMHEKHKKYYGRDKPKREFFINHPECNRDFPRGPYNVEPITPTMDHGYWYMDTCEKICLFDYSYLSGIDGKTITARIQIPFDCFIPKIKKDLGKLLGD